MTRDEIIKLARMTGASFETAESMFAFADIIAAAERDELVATLKSARVALVSCKPEAAMLAIFNIDAAIANAEEGK